MAPKPITDQPVALAWLVSVRWTTLLAGLAAILAGRAALHTDEGLGLPFLLLGLFAGSNLWLMVALQRERVASAGSGGTLVCADVLLLTWLLSRSGGVLNPASVFYLVQIVVAALVLGRTWTWVVTALSVSGYAALFQIATSELTAVQVMHPEMALHMRGMWLAFACTSLIIATLVTRLVIALEGRDRSLERLRDRTARSARLASMAAVATGAAHELSTPLATIAVAARELERALNAGDGEQSLSQDAHLIRTESDRCRRIISDMAARLGEPRGQLPRDFSLDDVMKQVLDRLSDAERIRVDLTVSSGVRLVWPVGLIAPAVVNLVRNGLQASAEGASIQLRAHPAGQDIDIVIVDRGVGMSAEHAARVGEPFFTTKSTDAGSGLGVFVSRSVAEQLGGSLRLHSTLGIGTTATLTLPQTIQFALHAEQPESHSDGTAS